MLAAPTSIAASEPGRRPLAGGNGNTLGMPAMHAGTSGLLAALLLAGIFIGDFFLFRAHNDFPAYYHEDEPTKADQIIHGNRNYNHPQLLLEATELAVKASGTPRRLQPVVEMGRNVSATLGALAALALATAGWRRYGLGGLVITGAFIGLCPALLVYSHYLKEDAALIFGICLFLLACQLLWELLSSGPVRSRRVKVRVLLALIFLGSACGVATSGKYTGAACIAMALPLAAAGCRPRWFIGAIRVAIVVVAAAAVFAAINHRALGQASQMLLRIRAEKAQAAAGIWGMALHHPNLYHPMMFVRQTPALPLALAALLALISIIRPRLFAAELCLAVFAGGYLLLIAFCSMPFNRYVLPVVVMAHFMAAVAVLRFLAVATNPAIRRWMTAGAAVVVVAVLLPRCLDFDRQFADDSRERLRAWVARNLPDDAVFVQDGYVALGEQPDPRLGAGAAVPLRIFGSTIYGGGQSAADAGSLDSLRRLGVDYVAVSDTVYNWYLDPNVAPRPDESDSFSRRRRWYQDLFQNEMLVWDSTPRHPTWSQYNNPAIRLYRLRPEAQ